MYPYTEKTQFSRDIRARNCYEKVGSERSVVGADAMFRTRGVTICWNMVLLLLLAAVSPNWHVACESTLLVSEDLGTSGRMEKRRPFEGTRIVLPLKVRLELCLRSCVPEEGGSVAGAKAEGVALLGALMRRGVDRPLWFESWLCGATPPKLEWYTLSLKLNC